MSIKGQNLEYQSFTKLKLDNIQLRRALKIVRDCLEDCLKNNQGPSARPWSTTAIQFIQSRIDLCNLHIADD